MSSPQSQPDLLHKDDFWSDDFWSSHAPAVDQHETGSTSDGQEVDSRVTTAEHDSSLATKPRLRLLP